MSTNPRTTIPALNLCCLRAITTYSTTIRKPNMPLCLLTEPFAVAHCVTPTNPANGPIPLLQPAHRTGPQTRQLPVRIADISRVLERCHRVAADREAKQGDCVSRTCFAWT